MDILEVKGVEIEGIVACLPENTISTKESCFDLYGEKGVETLIKATGIKARCVANPGTTTLDMCVTAAKELFEKNNIALDEIGAVICVTFTPEHIMPADAPSAQSRLGLSNNCMAFDINMACSGYGYGLYMGALLTKQLNKKILVLDGDVQSAYVSKYDKATMPVMGDVGTATLLTPADTEEVWKFAFYSDGNQRNVLYIPAGGSKKKTTIEDITDVIYEDGSKRKNIDIFMDGYGIFKFVAITASKFIKNFMIETKLSDENIDVFVPHQANIYMISELTKKLKIDKGKMWKSGDIYGNPSSASVPLTIAENANNWLKEQKGTRTLFSGFGGGLSISVGSIKLNKNAYYSVIKYGELK